MNMFRHNGITSLSEMKRLYDLSSSPSSLGEITDNTVRSTAPVYANGGNIYWPGGFLRNLIKGMQDARDSKIGAVGAGQLRDLQSEDNKELADNLAREYTKANLNGIVGAISGNNLSALTDIALNVGMIPVDMAIDGKYKDPKQIGRDMLVTGLITAAGHGIGKLAEYLKRPEINKELSKRVQLALENMTDADKLGTTNVHQGLKQALINEGVNPDLLTQQNLIYLTMLRQRALEEANIAGRYVIRQPLNRTDEARYVVFNGVEGTKPNRYLGRIDITDKKKPKIDYVSNATRHTPTPEKHVSETAMNAVIDDLGSVISGRDLLTPEATMKVLDKYLNKEVIGNWGEHLINGKYIDGFNVYRLTQPTYHVPIKYADIFSANGIDDSGKFITDFNLGPELSNGGKIHIKPEIFSGKVYYRNGGILEGDFDVDEISDEELRELAILGYDVEIL